jgi:hypothetical protein
MFERIPEKASKNALFMTHLYSKILESEVLHSPMYGNRFMLMLRWAMMVLVEAHMLIAFSKSLMLNLGLSFFLSGLIFFSLPI